MNIEELELSLRTEFEGQIRNVLAGVKKDVAEFQKKFEAEFEKHRSELDRTISELSEKLPESSAADAAFIESVGEHLRLARDDGAQVAATAFGEAEKLKAESERTENFDVMRDAIADISSKTSQATILQALVDGAAKFTSRGAFFIVKNDHIVGWKVFGNSAPADDGRVREVHFPASDDTVLSAAIRTMSMASAVNSQFSGDSVFLEALNFGSVESSYAIPLTARGRGVAVLYADAGHGGKVNVEALETLVRVAGLTVELLAASQSAPAPAAQPAAEAATTTAEAQEVEAKPAQEVEDTQEAVAEEYVGNDTETESIGEAMAEAPAEVEPEPTEVVTEYTGEVSYEVDEGTSSFEPANLSEQPKVESFQPVYEDEPQPEAEVETSEHVAGEMPEVAEFETFQPADESMADEAQSASVEVSDSRFELGNSESYDASYQPEEVAEQEEFVEENVPLVEAPVAKSPVAFNGNGNGHSTQVADPVVEVAAVQPTKSRLSDRNVDLPIEVADDERRLHNDARRFARLLVSEIKLYNEQKVTEGREANDLYDRLREAIDRSREMYDKRVQPAVASKFDYFHYELVNSLAEGVEDKLGANYSGASV